MVAGSLPSVLSLHQLLDLRGDAHAITNFPDSNLFQRRLVQVEQTVPFDVLF